MKRINLYSELEIIIKDYKIDAIFRNNGEFVTLAEIESRIWNDFYLNILKETNITTSIYGGGKWGKYVYAKLCSYIGIKSVIDNYVKWEESEGRVQTYEEWLEKNETKRVLITNINNAEYFKTQLWMDGYKGEVIDVFEWIRHHYPDVEKPLCDYEIDNYLFCSYQEVNKYIRKYEQNNDYDSLRKIIYSLFRLKDFHSAELYIEDVSKHNLEDYKGYKKAIDCVKRMLNKAVSEGDYSGTTIINIIDAFPNYAVDNMPFLSEYANSNLRMTGIINNYPVTSYALRGLFTSKMPFEIILEETKITKDSSEILQYADREGIDIYYVASLINFKEKISSNYNDVICDEKYCDMTLTQILFEGLHLACRTEKKKIILLHSIKEVHPPCFYVGSYRKVYFEVTSWNAYKENRENTFSYIDNVLRWYYSYYDKMNCSLVTMGDHGSEATHDYETEFQGVKYDLPYCIYERSNPVMIIHTEHIEGERLDGLISFNNMQQVIMWIIKRELYDNLEKIQNMVSEWVELQQIPTYHPTSCERFIPKGKWGAYEAAIGIFLKDEIYLKYITGKEVYYRFREYNYRNLINNVQYKERIEYCRWLLHDKTVPASLYKKNKFIHHMNCLKRFNTPEYEYINSIIMYIQ